MSDLVQAVLSDGAAVWVRVDDDEDGPRDTGFGQSVARRLEDLPGTLEAVTRSVREGLRAAAPDEVSLEFGIEVVGKSGKLVSVLTDLGAKATLKVSVTWRRDEPERTALGPAGPEGAAPDDEAAPPRQGDDGRSGADAAESPDDGA
ncbi:CU044_2847 family protein [Streptomyces sp. NPDC005931]|uniref:CU044_2847 family protein n=1 Tax=Streptomyces sp. NPDC005931 TaxID=3364737 RepID=UPI00369458DD